MPDSAGFVRDTEPFRRELLAHCYRMLGSIQDAEDLVQETYLRAWRSYGGFEGRSSVRTWLYQIATNRCLTELAKRSRRMLPSGLSDPEPDPDAYLDEAGPEVSWLQPAPDAMVIPDSADPAAIVAAREGLRLALIASLQYLPPRQRAVLVLRDVLAFPAAEVAVMLGTTTASVKSALQRARARLEELAPGRRPDHRADRAAAPARSSTSTSRRSRMPTPPRWSGSCSRTPPWRRHRCAPGSPAAAPACRSCATTSWDRLVTGACWPPAPTGSLPPRPTPATSDGNYQPYGICVLTVTGAGIRRISSFGDPGLVTVFGFGPDIGYRRRATPSAAPSGPEP